MIALASRARAWQRRGAIAGLTLLVSLGHGCIAERLAQQLSDAASTAQMPPRIAVAYVREMALTEPPVAAAAPIGSIRNPRRQRPAAVAPAASAPAQAPETTSEATATPEPAPPAFAPSPAADAGNAGGVEAMPAAPVEVGAAGPVDAPAFQWPESTRMSYLLSGNYRGRIDGTASVEWVRNGDRYQLFLDVDIGPLMSRRMRSEGRLTVGGLAPEHYEEATDRLFAQRRHARLRFEPSAVVLASGERQSSPADVQDAVSQFVQLTFLMTTQPALQRPGSSIAMPLALPRRIAPWIYEVLEPELLPTRFGNLQTIHVKPRLGDRRGGELSAQVWIAPQLQYLPVRIRIEQDADTFIDLMIDRLPQLAAAAPRGAEAPSPSLPEIASDR